MVHMMMRMRMRMRMMMMICVEMHATRTDNKNTWHQDASRTIARIMHARQYTPVTTRSRDITPPSNWCDFIDEMEMCSRSRRI